MKLTGRCRCSRVTYTLHTDLAGKPDAGSLHACFGGAMMGGLHES